MNIDDAAILERIERLAYQAGVAARGGQAVAEKAANPLADKIKVLAGACINYTGDALFHPTDATKNVSWADIYAYAKEL